MGKIKLFICLAVFVGELFSGPMAWGQRLEQLYVSPLGFFLGGVFAAYLQYPISIYTDGTGHLIWLEIRVPEGFLHVYPTGNVTLVETKPSVTVEYRDGFLRRVGRMSVSYDNLRVSRIGDLSFFFENARLERVGNLDFEYSSGMLHRIGGIPLEYENGMIKGIGTLQFRYVQGRLAAIGGVEISYRDGMLEQVKGSIPGVEIKVTPLKIQRR